MTVLHQTEAQLERAILELAAATGWRSAHFRAARTARGWRTPVSGDGTGYPDLTLIRAPELLFVELKAQRGKLSDAQRQWLQALDMCEIEVYVWKPSDWPEIEARLTRPRQPIRHSDSGRIHWNGLEMARGP